MTRASYDVHGILGVLVDAPEAMHREIDYHLHPFRTRDPVPTPDIVVAPYDGAPATEVATVVDDYEFGGGAYLRRAARIRFDLLAAPQSYYMDRLDLPVNLLIQLGLLRKAHTFIHGAGIEVDGGGILLPAYPGTGKTTILTSFVRNGAKLFGDDLCIVGNGRIYSYPQALSVYPHHLAILGYSTPEIRAAFDTTALIDRALSPLAGSRSRAARLIRAAVGRLRTPAINVDPALVFGSDAIAGSAALREIVALERSTQVSGLVQESMDPASLATHAAAVLWHEWHPWFHDLLLYDALAEGGAGTVGRFHQVRDLARAAFTDRPCSRVRIPAHWDNTTLVREFTAFWPDRSR